ncbi:MAG: hypothetical protein WAN35_02740 [Terracidiphilus sp.]
MPEHAGRPALNFLISPIFTDLRRSDIFNGQRFHLRLAWIDNSSRRRDGPVFIVVD